MFEACARLTKNMAAAVEALAERKFGSGGTGHEETPGAWSESAAIRGAAGALLDEFKACVSLSGPVHPRRLGKFPGTVTAYASTSLRAGPPPGPQLVDHFERGRMCKAHAEHIDRWPGSA